MGKQRKNLIIFLSDNHAGGLMGCAGHPIVKTPNLDGLASRGTLFRKAYTTSPICCPARASLATGRYPHETGYWDNVLAYDGKTPSWMHRARDAGVTVASIGKLHYRGGDDYGFTQEILPMHLYGGKGAIRNLLRGYDDEPGKKDSAWYDMYALSSGVGDTKYQDYDRKITAAAKAWLEEMAGSRKPWILLVSWVSPHPPFTVPQRLLDRYPYQHMPLPVGWRGEGWAGHPAYRHIRRLEQIPDLIEPDVLRKISSAYFGLITHLDEQIGEVMDAVGKYAPAETTNLLYTSDHGELFGSHGLLGKRVFYEQSVAVPMILAGADVPAGRRSDQLACHVDLFPTVLEALDIPLSAEDADLPGRSLFALANRMAAGPDGRLVFAEFHAHGSAAGASMIRGERYKLIYHVGMPVQLFDLAVDPDETRDVAFDPGYSEVLRCLLDALREQGRPEAIDARAKADQRRRVDELGGREQVSKGEAILFSPPPGEALEPRAKPL